MYWSKASRIAFTVASSSGCAQIELGDLGAERLGQWRDLHGAFPFLFLCSRRVGKGAVNVHQPIRMRDGAPCPPLAVAGGHGAAAQAWRGQCFGPRLCPPYGAEGYLTRWGGASRRAVCGIRRARATRPAAAADRRAECRVEPGTGGTSRCDGAPAARDGCRAAANSGSGSALRSPSSDGSRPNRPRLRSASLAADSGASTSSISSSASAVLAARRRARPPART